MHIWSAAVLLLVSACVGAGCVHSDSATVPFSRAENVQDFRFCLMMEHNTAVAQEGMLETETNKRKKTEKLKVSFQNKTNKIENLTLPAIYLSGKITELPNDMFRCFNRNNEVTCGTSAKSLPISAA